jgi:hypothetical protein
MDDTSIDPRRLLPVSIEWTKEGLIGRLYIGREYWGAVEWSEKRQMWCIEDVLGACLKHTSSIHGQAAAKEEAETLAGAMIRDGRFPSPEEANAARRERRAQRRAQPAQRRKAEERKRQYDKHIEVMMSESRARWAEEAEPPLYAALADVFDFADPELWKSNSFAALRPRLEIHVRAAVARLEYDLERTVQDVGRQPKSRRGYAQAAAERIAAQLERAREILTTLAR